MYFKGANFQKVKSYSFRGLGVRDLDDSRDGVRFKRELMEVLGT